MNYPPTIKVGPDFAGGHMFTLPIGVGRDMLDVIPKDDFYSYLAEKSTAHERQEFEVLVEHYRQLHENRRYLTNEYNEAGLAVAQTMKKCLTDSTVYFQRFSEHEKQNPEEIN